MYPTKVVIVQSGRFVKVRLTIWALGWHTLAAPMWKTTRNKCRAHAGHTTSMAGTYD